MFDKDVVLHPEKLCFKVFARIWLEEWFPNLLLMVEYKIIWANKVKIHKIRTVSFLSARERMRLNLYAKIVCKTLYAIIVCKKYVKNYML